MHSTSYQMNVLLNSTSCFTPLKRLPPLVHSPPLFTFNSIPKIRKSINFPRALRISVCATTPASIQGTDSVVHFEDFVEKDWSFLDTTNETNAEGGHLGNIDRIISAGKIEETSKVLISLGSEAFVDRVVNSSPCGQIFVVHESLLILACVKEKYDKVKCWQGELIDVPEKWMSFDVVYLYFLPALPFGLDQILSALAKRISPGARLVISHPEGRELVEEQRRQYPDLVVSNLPDKMTLQSSAVNHSFEVVEFVDEPGFYLTVLRFNAESDK